MCVCVCVAREKNSFRISQAVESSMQEEGYAFEDLYFPDGLDVLPVSYVITMVGSTRRATFLQELQ